MVPDITSPECQCRAEHNYLPSRWLQLTLFITFYDFRPDLIAIIADPWC